MTGVVDICNSALGLLAGAAKPIQALTEQSNEAIWCRQYFDETRQEILQSAPWNFATRAGYLSLLKAAPGTPANQTAPTLPGWQPGYPPPPWLYEYARPDQALQTLRIIPQTCLDNAFIAYFGVNTFVPLPPTWSWQNVPPVPFVDMQDTNGAGNMVRVIVTNQYQAIAAWIIDVPNPDLWDALFTKTFIRALASKIAMPLTGKDELATKHEQGAEFNLDKARVRDGDAGLTVMDHTPDWIAGRGLSYGWGNGWPWTGNGWGGMG